MPLRRLAPCPHTRRELAQLGDVIRFGLGLARRLGSLSHVDRGGTGPVRLDLIRFDGRRRLRFVLGNDQIEVDYFLTGMDRLGAGPPKPDDSEPVQTEVTKRALSPRDFTKRSVSRSRMALGVQTVPPGMHRTSSPSGQSEKSRSSVNTKPVSERAGALLRATRCTLAPIGLVSM